MPSKAFLAVAVVVLVAFHLYGAILMWPSTQVETETFAAVPFNGD